MEIAVGKSATRNIVVVGGGSAGWMAGAFLSKVLGIDARSDFSVTVVESQEVPPIGVGEATVHTMRDFLGATGVQEGEFLLAADATLKHGILFRDWLHGPAAPGGRDQYFHSFEPYPPIAPELMANHWLNARHHGACSERYDQWAGVQGALAASNVSPKSWQNKPFEGVVPYGYHLDANKFAHHLKSVAIKRGVSHVLGHIEDVALDKSGSIAGLLLRDGQRIEGDFFIDCSGFNSILMKRLDAQFISYSDRLFTDAAVTVRLPKKDATSNPRPYTTATARAAGWTFEIDLRDRSGLGYVYSSGYVDSEKAERELRSYIGDGHEDLPVNHIKTRVGRLKEAWVKNCVAIGLSSGFLEPLESTGLYFIELALRLFVDYVDMDSPREQLRNSYNKVVAHIFDEVAQFIVLHYILTERNDTEFWRDVRAKTKRLPELDEKLELWRLKPPTDSDFTGPATPFGAANYSAILFGMQRMTEIIPAPVRHIPTDQSLSHYKKLKNIQHEMITSLPRHDEFLKKYMAAFST